MKTAELPGSYPDVTYHDGALYLASVHNDVQVHRFDGTRFHPVAAYPCGGNGFACLRSVNAELYLFYRPNDGRHAILQNITTGEQRIYEPTSDSPAVGFYNWPLALGDNGYCVTSLHEWCRVYTYDGQLDKELPSQPGTGTAYLTDMNLPVSMDANLGTMYDPWRIWNPERSNGLAVGEDESDSGGVGCVFQDRVKRLILAGQFTALPKVARNGALEQWALVTTNYSTVTLVSDIIPSDFDETPPEPGPDPGYNPKEDLVRIQADLAAVIRKL